MSSPPAATPAASDDASVLASLGTYKTLQLRMVAPHVLNLHLSIGKLNAMSQLFWREMRDCCVLVGSCRSVRVVLLTAEGRVFTAGLDLADHADSFLTRSGEGEGGADVARRVLRMGPSIAAYQAAFSALESMAQPVVAAVQGACVGGGVDLVTAADIRWCSADAWFSVKEVDVGMAADVGSLARLPKITGNASLVREWCYTGRKVPASEALSAGLVSRVLPSTKELLSESLALCVEIAAKSPLAVTGTKIHLNYARDHSVKEALDFVALWNASALQSQDVAIAMQASLTKQQPIFSNL